jgi:hypothetical protein
MTSQLMKKPKAYNCYGFVAYKQGWKKEVENLTFDEITFLLETEADYVAEEYVQKGDIAVYEVADYVTHVAIVKDAAKHTLVHKPGAGKLEVSTYKNKYGTPSYFKRSVE